MALELIVQTESEGELIDYQKGYQDGHEIVSDLTNRQVNAILQQGQQSDGNENICQAEGYDFSGDTSESLRDYGPMIVIGIADGPAVSIVFA
jgi:hypothetical protein